MHAHGNFLVKKMESNYNLEVNSMNLLYLSKKKFRGQFKSLGYQKY